MPPKEMKSRTKQFALGTIKLCETLASTRPANIIANQLIRSATAVGANYREACHARSDADFVSKSEIARKGDQA
jgi:four helix bundle protein